MQHCCIFFIFTPDMRTFSKTYKPSDLLGILFSSLCLVHCILAPFIIIALGIVPSHEHSILSWHNIFLVLTLLAVLFSIKHANKYIKIGLIAGFILLCVGTLFESHGTVYKYVLYAGSLSLIFFHILNYFTHKH